MLQLLEEGIVVQSLRNCVAIRPKTQAQTHTSDWFAVQELKLSYHNTGTW